MTFALEKISQPELFQRVGDICTTVNTVVSTKDLFEQSLKKTLALFGANRGSIFILNDTGERLCLETAHGMKTDEEKTMVKQMGEGIVGQVAQSKKPIFVDNISDDNRFHNFKARKGYRTSSFICAPLMVKDQLIGVINITDKETGSSFKKEEMQLLDFLASQIALNYRRVQLYRKFKRVIKETRNLKDKLGQTDEEARHLKKQINIQEKLATIGKLAGGIAHEFNNPLDGVMRYTNLCLENVEEDDIVRGYLLEIKHGLNRMAKIVKNLLACSRNEVPTRQKLDFKKVLEHVVSLKQASIDHKDIKVVTKIESEIPLIYDLGIERVLTNLLHNAIDAIEEDGVITLQVVHKDGQLIFQINDTGSGIKPENVDQIFEPFFTTKDIDKGCGLGLTIVGEIIKSYEGKIDVKSESGEGTTFTIAIPVEKR